MRGATPNHALVDSRTLWVGTPGFRLDVILQKNGRYQKGFFRNYRVHLVGFGLLMRLQGSKHQIRHVLIKGIQNLTPVGIPAEHS